MGELVLKGLAAAVLASLGVAYGLGCRRLHLAGYPAPRWRIALYAAGLAALVVALLSPIDELAHERFSAHMVQHLLLTMVAAPLLLLGNPLPVSLWGLPRGLRRALARPLMRGAGARLALGALTTLPAAWLIYVGNLWVWHLPVLYDAALEHDWLHALEHLAFFSTSVLFWWPIVCPAPRLHRPPHPGFQIVYLVAATAQNTILGMLLTLPERVLYGYYGRLGPGALDDQMLAGGIMWTNAHMYLLPILVILWNLARDATERQTPDHVGLAHDA
jgi:putative membrane protein